MRLGELRGLRWGDADLDAGLIHVRQRASQWMQIGPPKSKAGKRDIPLAPIVVNTLRQWQATCPKGGNLDLVFPNTVGHIDSVQGNHARFGCHSKLNADSRPTPASRTMRQLHCSSNILVGRRSDCRWSWATPRSRRPLIVTAIYSKAPSLTVPTWRRLRERFGRLSDIQATQTTNTSKINGREHI